MDSAISGNLIGQATCIDKRNQQGYQLVQNTGQGKTLAWDQETPYVDRRSRTERAAAASERRLSNCPHYPPYPKVLKRLKSDEFRGAPLENAWPCSITLIARDDSEREGTP